MRACTAPSCRSPTASHAQVRWLVGSSCARPPACEIAAAAPALAARSRLGSPRRRRHAGAHGGARRGGRRARPLPGLGLVARRRAPPRSTSSCSPLREAAAGAGADARAGLPRRRALRGRADARHRHALALEPRGLLGAGARLKARCWRATPATRALEAAGLARAPLHRLRGSDPNWSHARFAAIERRHGFRSTCFVLAAHRDPHDGAAPEAYARRRPRLVARARPPRPRGRAARELHRAWPTSASARGERAELARLLGGPIAGNRHHYLRLPWHDGHPRARPAGLRRTTRRSGTRSGPGPRRALASRSGPGTSPRARRCASSSCRSS